MKKMMLICLALIFGAGQQMIAGGADKTIENLKAAFKGESTASAKYAAYARQARQEGQIQIAAMFEATSRAEQIHAANHQTVLVQMGQKADPVKPEFTLKTTPENLQDAISGETYEMTTMYPGFIATAKAEDAAGAAKSFRWAMETEKKHQVMYQNALNALNNKKTDTLPKVYWVCPKCGNTYDVAAPEASCSFCSTKKEKFIKFGK
ncbi:MAG: ferritin-like domain-containing protein [Bacteroidetes bacterium]|nr:ferritin-like domain-containing protein [Bacteroidota bacterium]